MTTPWYRSLNPSSPITRLPWSWKVVRKFLSLIDPFRPLRQKNRSNLRLRIYSCVNRSSTVSLDYGIALINGYCKETILYYYMPYYSFNVQIRSHGLHSVTPFGPPNISWNPTHFQSPGKQPFSFLSPLLKASVLQTANSYFSQKALRKFT